PAPPPNDVPELDDTPVPGKELGLRERLELHRSDPACAGCHRRMDPLGFSLENFNAIGAWREEQNGQPLDTVGSLPDGATLEGPVELKNLLVTSRRDQFLRCLTAKLMTYALGRKLEFYDDAA